KHLLELEDPVFEFNRQIIAATQDLCVAYKPNLAFYESQGWQGWRTLEKTMALIPSDVFTIADAKRGDIGNTARKYAEAFYDKLGVDAVTIAPYMGRDSVEPFLGRPGKWGVVLGVTSNDGARDLQFLTVDGGEQRLFERVMEKAASWGSVEDTMFVVGATRAEVLAQARTAAPHHFFLVPGVGAQGGDLKAVLDAGLTADGGLLINSSRGILYAGKDADAIPAARRAALHMRDVMALKLRERGII
ncbi:MAG TPA: orotidine-5'-phosphate decarboxylase, partial [Flavobacteriales bacterium]|nr:orotidine-5'-phosphate decarboxylase [Flavobacteriales bacterium]